RNSQGRLRALQYGHGATFEADGLFRRASHGPRFPLDLPGLGSGADGLPKPCSGNGARPQDRRQGGGRIPAWRPNRETRTVDGGLGEVLRQGRIVRQGGCPAMIAKVSIPKARAKARADIIRWVCAKLDEELFANPPPSEMDYGAWLAAL